LRFAGTCFRAHDPRWSFSPLSGEGARLRGGRFNPAGVPALYLALSISTAIKEANQGFAHKIEPCVLCSYDVDCADIADLRRPEDRKRYHVTPDDMSCAWFELSAKGLEPSSWAVARQLIGAGLAGALVPSFVNSADDDDQNLVLWKWGKYLPYRVAVYDPSGKLPRNHRLDVMVL
jgi:RES domain-containing protein